MVTLNNIPKRVILRICRCLSIMTLSVLTLISCEEFLDVPSPSSKIPTELVFEDDVMATSALTGIYLDLYSATSFAGGSNQSVVSLTGLSADELVNKRDDPSYLQFESNQIDPSSTFVRSLWSSMYKSIYEANGAMEGLDASTTVTASVKKQLKGEALFVRAFCYFYLTNLFGDVPLATSTDYKKNTTLRRNTVAEVYDQIKADLVAAEDLLADGFTGTDRIRPNRSAATALLARVYLYTGDWPRAEDKAGNIIAKTDQFSLPADPNNTFLSTSKEAIWQLRPNDGVFYTNEGYTFSPSLAANVLRDEVIEMFEPSDKRKTSWTASIMSGNDVVYLPYKYKRLATSTVPIDEYSMVLRLAEMYLIRAEARLQQDKFSGAIADVDMIRQRAGLTRIQDTNPGINESDLMLSIEQERRIEFLAEWGHRWLDLRRWKRAEAVLAPVKTAWSNDDQLYPVPSSELSKNINLQPQNAGY